MLCPFASRGSWHARRGLTQTRLDRRHASTHERRGDRILVPICDGCGPVRRRRRPRADRGSRPSVRAARFLPAGALSVAPRRGICQAPCYPERLSMRRSRNNRDSRAVIARSSSWWPARSWRPSRRGPGTSGTAVDHRILASVIGEAARGRGPRPDGPHPGERPAMAPHPHRRAARRRHARRPQDGRLRPRQAPRMGLEGRPGRDGGPAELSREHARAAAQCVRPSRT